MLTSVNDSAQCCEYDCASRLITVFKTTNIVSRLACDDSFDWIVHDAAPWMLDPDGRDPEGFRHRLAETIGSWYC